MKKTIYVALALMLIGLIGATAVSLSTDLFHPVRADAQKQTAALGGVNTIKIAAASADVTVEKTKSRKLTAEIQGWGNKRLTRDITVDIRKDGRRLYITADQRSHFIQFSFGWVRLVIKVPDRHDQSIVVTTGSGDVTVHALRAGNLSAISRSGDITAENNQSSKRFTAKTSSGDIDVRRIHSEGAVSLTADSGDTVVDDLTAKETEIDSASGDVTVRDFNGRLTVQADSGDIGLEGDRLTGDIAAAASSGDVTIGFAHEPDSLALDFRGNSGEAAVEIGGLLYKEKSEQRIIGEKGGGRYRMDVRTRSGDFRLQ